MEKQNNNVDKLTDKAFSRSVFIAVVSIVLCIVCLSSATFAWFTTTTTSSQNVVSGGFFGLVVIVTDENGDPVQVTERADGSFACTLGGEGSVYSVTLRMSDDTTVTKGFCNVKKGNDTYQTQSMRVGESETISFTLTLSGTGGEVIFAPAWGLPAAEKVGDGGTLDIAN